MADGPAVLVLPEGQGDGPTDLDAGEITFIGTATVLLRYGGLTILTDPNFLHAGDKAYLGLGLSSRRLTEPAMSIAELPPLDLIVLSHHHGGHFDDVAVAQLPKDVPIITEPHSARKLASQGFERPIALETWQAQVVTKGETTLRITATPGKHAPRAIGAFLPPVMGSMLDFEDGRGAALRLYVTGDTLLHGRLAEIPRRYPRHRPVPHPPRRHEDRRRAADDGRRSGRARPAARPTEGGDPHPLRRRRGVPLAAGRLPRRGRPRRSGHDDPRPRAGWHPPLPPVRTLRRSVCQRGRR